MTRERIVLLFPRISEIRNEQMRENTISAIQYAAELGGWNDDTVMNCPMTMKWRGSDVTLVEHVNTTATLCMASYETMQYLADRHHAEFDHDIILCGALLHDIGKFTECICVDGVPTRGDSRIMRHPLHGAIIASRFGLPDKVVHLIAVHSYEGDQSYMTPEADLVKRCDLLAFHAALYGVEK